MGLQGRQLLALLALSALAAAASLAACGGGEGDEAPTDVEKAADVELLNASLAQELTTIDAYSKAIPHLRKGAVPAVQQLRAQAQEHVNALTKAIRGLGGATDAEKGEVDYAEIESGPDFLALLYEMEGAAYSSYLDAAPLLETAAPRRLAAALAASEAQHLVVLRQLLGAGRLESYPEAFESGEPLGSAAADRGR